MNPPRAPSRVRGLAWDRGDASAVAGLSACTVLAAILLVRAPSVVGATQDDGVYLCTAKALAEGRGYRLIHLPGEPWQTKYPILYPLVLAGVWRIWPQFPDNVPAIQVGNALLWGVGSWIAYRLMRRGWELPWWLAAGCAALGLVSYATLSLLQTAMSEALYFPLSLAALAAAAGEKRSANAERGPGDEGARGDRGGRTCRGRLGRAALAGGLAGGAYLTRSIGIAVVVSVVAHLLLRRLWREALVAAGVAALAVSGWAAWRVYTTNLNARIPTSAALQYELDYSTWIPASLREAGWVAGNNAAEAALALVRDFAPPPHGWLVGPLAGGTWRGLPAYAILCGVLILSGIGFVATFRRGRGVVQAYATTYIALVLVWPYGPQRFLTPLLPFLFAWPITGVSGLVERVARFVTGNSAGAARRVSPAVVLLAMLAYLNVPFVLNPPGRDFLIERLRDREALACLLDDVTPPDAVICTTYAGYLHLVTGRKVAPMLFCVRPAPHAYPRDRIVLECGTGFQTRLGEEADARIVSERWIDYFTSVGASYVVPPGEGITYGAAFDELCRTNPGRFARVGSAGGYELYRFIR